MIDLFIFFVSISDLHIKEIFDLIRACPDLRSSNQKIKKAVTTQVFGTFESLSPIALCGVFKPTPQSLFIRESSGIRLTELGQRMVRYCQMKVSLEGEFIGQIRFQKSNSLAGTVKIRGFLLWFRSVLIPSITPILSEHTDVQVEFLNREVRQLPGLLESGQAILFY